MCFGEMARCLVRLYERPGQTQARRLRTTTASSFRISKEIYLRLHIPKEPQQPPALMPLSLPPSLSSPLRLCPFRENGNRYYSYKYAEVMSADAFAAFEEAGLDDEEAVSRVGMRFKDTVLAMGGGRHPSKVFRDFRGRDPTPEALLKHSGLAAAVA